MAYMLEYGYGVSDMMWIWNVSHTVSPRIYSHRPDVMLVQHAINTVMVQLGLKDSQGKQIYYLKRDGYIGPKTSEAIAAYQRSLVSSGRYVKADGAVDPAGSDPWTADGKGQYTIVFLNRDHRKIYGTMMDEAQFPQLLQEDLRRNKLRP